MFGRFMPRPSGDDSAPPAAANSAPSSPEVPAPSPPDGLAGFPIRGDVPGCDFATRDPAGRRLAGRDLARNPGLPGVKAAGGVQAIVRAQEVVLESAADATQLMQGVTAAIDKLAVTSGMARNAAGALTEAMDGLRRSSVMISGELGRSDAVADQVTAYAARTREGAEGLGLSVNEIGAIVDLIAGLARQTSYLAINAAIEAARAGEAGRGFSIVAGEVKSLAQATHDATDKLTAVIQRVRSGAERNSAGVAALDSAIADLRGALGRVGGALEIQAQSAHEIADTSSEALRMAELVEAERQTVAERSRLGLAAVESLAQAARSSRALCLALPQDISGGGLSPSGVGFPAAPPPYS